MAVSGAVVQHYAARRIWGTSSASGMFARSASARWVRRMVCRVASAYAANVLPELEALIKNEHKPVVGRTKGGKAAKARAPWQAPGRAHGTTASGLTEGRPPETTDPWRARRPFVF